MEGRRKIDEVVRSSWKKLPVVWWKKSQLDVERCQVIFWLWLEFHRNPWIREIHRSSLIFSRTSRRTFGQFRLIFFRKESRTVHQTVYQQFIIVGAKPEVMAILDLQARGADETHARTGLLGRYTEAFRWGKNPLRLSRTSGYSPAQCESAQELRAVDGRVLPAACGTGHLGCK